MNLLHCISQQMSESFEHFDVLSAKVMAIEKELNSLSSMSFYYKRQNTTPYCITGYLQGPCGYIKFAFFYDTINIKVKMCGQHCEDLLEYNDFNSAISKYIMNLLNYTNIRG